MYDNKGFFDDFTQLCKPVELKKEYTDYFDDEKFAIITELSEAELTQRFGTVLADYRPYVLLTPEMGEAMGLFWRNERKHQRRAERGHIFSVDEDFDEHHSEYAIPDFVDSLIAEEEAKILRDAMSELTEVQLRRVCLYFYEGLTYRDIAEIEGADHRNIIRSVEQALKKIKKFLEHTPQNGLPSGNK